MGEDAFWVDGDGVAGVGGGEEEQAKQQLEADSPHETMHEAATGVAITLWRRSKHLLDGCQASDPKEIFLRSRFRFCGAQHGAC